MEYEAEVKKPMKTWKKWLLGGLIGFAVFVGFKFTDDSYAELSKSCTFYGGTPAERSLFTSTASCTWPNQLMQKQVSFMGITELGYAHAERFCRIYKGRMSFRSSSDPVVCTFAQTK
jgi:hypothetical protein